MKAQTYLALLEELRKHQYGNTGEYNVLKLFKIYTSRELTSFNDVFKEHRPFLKFVDDNKLNFQGLEKQPDGKLSREDERSLVSMARYLSLRLDALHNKFYTRQREDQEKFTATVEKIIGNSPTRLLEVGSGEIPYSSILLAHDLGKITSMDHFLVSHDSLRALNIEPKDQFFDKTTDIDDYDLIVGQKPCSAIAEIVKKCGKSNKPYFLQLCDCDSPNHSLKGWESYLRLFDPRIKFSTNTNYAYNLDAPYSK